MQPPSGDVWDLDYSHANCCAGSDGPVSRLFLVSPWIHRNPQLANPTIQEICCFMPSVTHALPVGMFVLLVHLVTKVRSCSLS